MLQLLVQYYIVSVGVSAVMYSSRLFKQRMFYFNMLKTTFHAFRYRGVRVGDVYSVHDTRVIFGCARKFPLCVPNIGRAVKNFTHLRFIRY